jgi:hypothetical protein
MVVRGHPDIVVAALCGMAVPASAMPNRKNYPRACGRGTRARLEGLTGKQLELAPSYLTRLDGLAGWGGGIRTSAYSIGICQDSQPRGAGLELAHLESKMIELHFLQKSQAPDRRLDPVQAG